MQKNILFVMLFLIATTIYSQNPCPGTPTVNYWLKTYHTVQIGNQCWLKENLDVGKMTQANQEQTNNGIWEKYCYQNDEKNCEIYGGLYQWDEAMEYSKTTGTIGLCPYGWHVPTEAEFQTLFETVHYGNTLSSSGFSALNAGMRYYTGWFLGLHPYFWSSTESNSVEAQSLTLYNVNNSDHFSFSHEFKVYGYSVRCIKDETPPAIEGDNGKKIPTEYLLSQNYPNPFNPTTTINYSIPQRSFVTIKVYDALGKEVAAIVNGNKSAGNYNVDFNAGKLVSGTYLYKFQSGNFTQTKKMILMK